jgi:hypothetical protein
MPQYRQPPRLVQTGFLVRRRRFHDAFRIQGDGQVNVDAIAARGTTTFANSDVTMRAPQQNLIIDANSGNVDVTLPSSAMYPGVDVTIKRTDTNYAYQVNTNRQGSDVIDDDLTKLELHKPKESVTLLSDGEGNWITIDRFVAFSGHPDWCVKTTTSPYQLEWFNTLFVATKTTAGNQIVYLPRVEQCAGHTIYVKRRSAGITTQIQDFPGGSGNIDEGTQTITTDYGYRGFYCDGTNWRLISSKG